MEIKGKRILLITPHYYGYEKQICKALTNLGATVSVIYDNYVDYNFLYRCLRLNDGHNEITYNYYAKCLKKLENQEIDFVFAIRASSISEDIFSLIKRYCGSECKYIMYQWDSIKNNPRAKDLAQLFDAVYTFDTVDADKFNWNYRPLFYISNLVNTSQDKSLDMSFLCSWHSQRAEVLRRLRTIATTQKLSFFYSMKVGFMSFFKQKYFNRNPLYKGLSLDEVSFKSLSLEKSYELYGKSKVVVDYTHPEQTGFTMRTIECLGNHCKLITNNRLITNADFYNPNNILVYEGEEVVIPMDFISTPYENIDKDVYDYYSIESWAKNILGV